MRLESETGAPIDSPSGAAIERLLRSLDAEQNTFAILTDVPSTYMQTRACEGAFELEYQTGDTDQHYQATRPVSLDEVIDAFTRYAQGDDSWKSLCEWQLLDLESEPKAGCAGMVLLVVSLGAAALAMA